MYICKKCGKEYKNRYSYIGHCSSHNRGASYKEKRGPLKKEKNINHECKYCGIAFETGQKLGGHTIMCKNNPTRKLTIYKISKSNKNKIIKEKTKQKISESMKLAHKENRAWNIGMSRWNNTPSYPEKFFIKVIKNEFYNKKYIREYPVGKYSIDFAWYDKKIAIEIDGSQHERFKEYKERDIIKDKFLISKGWNILRIKWKDLYNDTKKWIKIANDFVGQ